jgi:tetratricopeptide (TPR) repeat protein
MLFTNFVTQFPTNGFAPQAQWWVADSFYNAGDFVNAEKNYKYIFQNTNWQGSPLENRTNLFYPAQMMAGRAAVGRLGYSDAIGYFTGLTSDTNCPPELDVQARFAWGTALMRMDSTDTNNPLANYEQAASIFKTINQSYPTNEWGALACGELGDCYLQLTNYDAATNAYAQVFNSSSANIFARSQAQIGFGIALEKKAAQAFGDNQTRLRRLALDNYLDVFYETNLRDGEQADPFWLKKAGLQALDVMQALQEWPQMDKFFDRLEERLPQLKDSLETKRAALLPGKK